MATKEKLRRPGRAGSLGKSIPNGTSRMGKAKGRTKNSDNAIGQLAVFFGHVVQTKYGGDYKAFAEAVECGQETVRKWLQGANGPKLGELQNIAKLLGYADWFEMAADAKRVLKKLGHV